MAKSFNLVSPVGLVLNVLLIPLVMVALWFGYGLLFCGLLIPALSGLFAFGFDGLLGILLDVADFASELDLGHLYIPTPATWWMVGCYLLLASVVGWRTERLSAHWGWRGLWGWLFLGLAVGLVPNGSGGVRCTFLAVGHGCSILVETPAGKTMLYDAGMINDSDRAKQIVQTALWERGLSRIDALVISHADVDHFSAVPGLLREIPIHSLLVSRHFLDFRQSGVVTVCETSSDEHVPIQLISAGDRIRLDRDVAIQVLHPQANFSAPSDNGNSLVVLLEYQGRRVLLTGDLEGEGLQVLLRQSPLSCDVMLAPHHGSLNSNPQEISEWAEPQWLVVSGGRGNTADALAHRYAAHTTILSTHARGAITFMIHDDGRLECRTQRDGPTNPIGSF